MTVSFQHGAGDDHIADSGQQAADGDNPQGANQGGSSTDNSGASNHEVVLEIGGRKYTREELEKKVLNADDHISKIEQENETLRQKAERGERIDDLLDTLKQKGGGEQDSTKEQQVTDTQNANPNLTPEQVEELVNKQIAEREASAQAQANFNKVTEEVTNRFGGEVDQVISKVAEDNGFTMEEAKQFAQRHPQAFLKLVPPKPEGSTPSPTEGNTNTQALGQQPAPKPGEGFWSATTDKNRVDAYLARINSQT